MIRATAVMTVVLMVVAGMCWAQDAPTIRLQDTGVLTVTDADGTLCTVELNCHGPDWTYASQSEATGALEDVGEGEKLLTGQLLVPEANGGSITFSERLKARDGGLDIEYEMGFSGPMTLHGLQVSVLLPANRFAGTSITVVAWDGAEWEIRLPLAPSDDDTWQLGEYLCRGVVLGDSSCQMEIDPAKAPEIAIYDLRRWERNEFEIRLPLIYDQDGKAVTDTDGLSLALTLSGIAQE